MGYMGFDMQRWISNMKPKPFFGRRNDQATEHPEHISGHHITELYHFKQNKLNNLNQKKSTEKYLKSLRQQIHDDNNKQRVRGLVILIISLSVLVASFIYFSKRFDLF